MKRVASLICAMMMLGVTHAGEIYVSTRGNDGNDGTKERPLASLAQALKQAREWRRTANAAAIGGISIYMDGGCYTIDRPLFVRPEDSGTEDSPTVIRSASKDDRATISGGAAVTGWHKGCPDKRIDKALQKKIWWAEAPMNGNRYVETRQMWVNGKKAVRATQFAPEQMERIKGFSAADKSISIPTPKNFEKLQTAQQLEMTVHQRWAIAILRVRSMEPAGDSVVVRFHEPESALEFSHPWPQPVVDSERGSSSFCLTNALQLVDEPGEWYQDYPSGRIYYYPREDEDMNTAEVTVPALTALMKIDGTVHRQVRFVSFEDVDFEYAAWTRPSHSGHVTLQGGFPLIDAYKLDIPGLPEKAELENQAWVERPESAIEVNHADNIRFSRCSFSHMGSTAIDLHTNVNSSAISRCRLTDIGGTAIMTGTFPDGGFETHIPYTPDSAKEICNNITIDNNLISDAANEDWGAVGIAAGYVSHTSIVHNEVCHVNYSGICVGWGWTPRRSGMESNHIDCNYVHHFARQLYDVGGLYTLSSQPGSTMCGNRIEALTDAPYATNDRAFYIYLDEATDGYTIDNNWCPEERFDSNRPGPDNRWGTNGPAVADEYRLGAGIENE